MKAQTLQHVTTFDCLIVNVFVPETKETNIPVYVDIHGGSFQYGHAAQRSFIDMVRRVRREIIVVKFNYRLGLHGFVPRYRICAMKCWDERSSGSLEMD